SRDHFKRNVCLTQCRHFLTGTAEDERISTLKPDDIESERGKGDHLGVDFFLLNALPTAALAHIPDLRGWRDQLQNAVTDQVVVEYNVGRSQHSQSLEGKQLRITGPGADQKHFAFHERPPDTTGSARRASNDWRLAAACSSARRCSGSKELAKSFFLACPNSSSQPA